jgi:hypothetical protein
MNMTNLDNASSLSGWEPFKIFLLLQNAHVPSFDPDQFGSRTQNMLSSEMRELSKATTVQPQKEIHGWQGWWRFPIVCRLFYFFPVPSGQIQPSHSCHAIGILVNTGDRLEGNIRKYAREENVTAWGRCEGGVQSESIHGTSFRGLSIATER